MRFMLAKNAMSMSNIIFGPWGPLVAELWSIFFFFPAWGRFSTLPSEILKFIPRTPGGLGQMRPSHIAHHFSKPCVIATMVQSQGEPPRL